MSIKWKSTQYRVKDIIKLDDELELELRPEYQRHSVWSHAAKIMLIDSILRNIPMPKIYVHVKTTPKGKTIRSVIDGQQRIRAILEFITLPEFKLVAPYSGEYFGYSYADFVREKIENRILDYLVDINEIYTDSDKVVREIYSRVNKYTVALNSQELRRADFPGDFLGVSEQLSALDFFEAARMFTPANRRRMKDIEFISELLAALINGPQNKKETLDKYYIEFTKWDKAHKNVVINRFKEILDDLKYILPMDNSTTCQGFDYEVKLNPFQKTRFRQNSDFYSLFIAIDELKQANYSLANKDITHLRADLALLDEAITPESTVNLFSKYAIQCTSQANTISSRKWRRDFLKRILAGTYIAQYPDDESIRAFHRILADLKYVGSDMCPPCDTMCVICEYDFNDYSDENMRVMWPDDRQVFQLSNACLVHRKCFQQKGFHEYIAESVEMDEDL